MATITTGNVPKALQGGRKPGKGKGKPGRRKPKGGRK